ncbi:hypothetical protein SeMB42_g08001, partial [Synchytrium endobioticum]
KEESLLKIFVSEIFLVLMTPMPPIAPRCIKIANPDV